MYKRISSLSVVLFFVGIVSYFFYYNPHEVSVHFGSENTYKLPLALTLIVSFITGVVFVTLFALIIGIKFKLEQWKLAKQMRLKDSHYEDLKKAHDFLSLKDADSARNLLQKVVQKDPHDILSRMSLAKTYSIQNKPLDALKLLETTRAEAKRSPALLIAIAEAQLALGNKTAAHDSVLLALRDNPKNIYLLELAITLSKDLGKLGDAKFLADELMKFSPYAEQDRISELMASIELLEIKDLKKNDPEEYEARLKTLLKNRKEYVPASIEYAELLFEQKESEQAVKILKKAITKSRSSIALTKLVTFWLDTENPSEALHTLRETISTEDTQLEMYARALLAQTLLHLEHPEDAKKEIKILEELFEQDQSKNLFLTSLKAKLDSKTPGRGKTNLALETIIIEEAERAGLPSLSRKLVHPNLEETSKQTLHLSIV
jgi:predicted Zn-dependent protease